MDQIQSFKGQHDEFSSAMPDTSLTQPVQATPDESDHDVSAAIEDIARTEALALRRASELVDLLGGRFW